MPSEVSAFASDSELPPAERAAMERALDLARRGWGRVAPNPLVGAVVLAGDKVVAEGYHAEYGGPHAEVVALKLATSIDGRIADAAGSSQWVSGEAAREHVHWVRAGFDAIAVGGTTALRDNPQLTV